MFRLREIWEESCGPGPARRFNFRLRADRSSLWGRIPSTVWSSLRHSCWCPKQSKDPSQSKSRAKTVPKLSTTDTEQARSRDGLLIGANGRSLLVLIKSSDFQLVILGLPLMGAMFGLCLGGPVGLLAGVTRSSQTCFCFVSPRNSVIPHCRWNLAVLQQLVAPSLVTPVQVLSGNRGSSAPTSTSTTSVNPTSMFSAPKKRLS